MHALYQHRTYLCTYGHWQARSQRICTTTTQRSASLLRERLSIADAWPGGVSAQMPQCRRSAFADAITPCSSICCLITRRWSLYAYNARQFTYKAKANCTTCARPREVMSTPYKRNNRNRRAKPSVLGRWTDNERTRLKLVAQEENTSLLLEHAVV